MNPEPWVSLDDISQHLAVSRDTVYRWIKRREMPAHRVGHQWKFKISQVDEWIQTGNAAEGSKSEQEE